MYTGERAPGDVRVVVPGEVARQEDTTEQVEQEKLIMYPLATVAWPWKVPPESIVTPVKEIQPALWSQAKPPRVPFVFVTPPLAGERLIQPSLALHA